jgi:tripartite-type tricarboxylate transporter receptor subunit TctC
VARMRRLRLPLPAIIALAPAFGISFAAHAQAPDFYKAKQIQLIVGYEAGNDYDLGARMLAKYLARHLPGQPTIIVQNMPQAAGVVAANSLYVRAPRDGTVLASISRNLASQAVMGQSNIEADPRRFIWLGATSFPGRVCVATSAAAVKTPDDLFKTELIVGSVGTGSSTSIVPTVLNRVLGTKFRLIEGYRGAQDVILAMERGEVHGLCSSLGQFRTHEQQIRDGKFRILFRAEETEMADIPNTPSIYDHAKTDEQRRLMRFVFSSTEFGRPYLFPPDVPAERVALMRKAIADAVRDPELVAEAQKARLDMTYRSPEHLERLVTKLAETSPEQLQAIKKIVPSIR